MGSWAPLSPLSLFRFSDSYHTEGSSILIFWPNPITPACQTPNCILQTNDVPVQPSRHTHLPLGTSHPRRSRYTLQWFAANDEILHATFPNNSDAAFLSHHKPKPSYLLLHYNYGAAAVKNWGRNHAILGSRSGLPRPHPPEPVAMGPTKSVGDRTTAIAKLTAGTTT